LTGAQSTLVKEENNNKIKSKPLLLSKINKKRKKIYIYIKDNLIGHICYDYLKSLSFLFLFTNLI